jgi:hypothetical protein
MHAQPATTQRHTCGPSNKRIIACIVVAGMEEEACKGELPATFKMMVGACGSYSHECEETGGYKHYVLFKQATTIKTSRTKYFFPWLPYVEIVEGRLESSRSPTTPALHAGPKSLQRKRRVDVVITPFVHHLSLHRWCGILIGCSMSFPSCRSTQVCDPTCATLVL